MRSLQLIYRYWFRLLLLLLALMTVLLAATGEHWTAALFHALQSIVLNYEVDIVPGSRYFWPLVSLQLAIPALASVGLIKNLFHDEIGPLLVRTWSRFRPPEAVVIGGGSVGNAIAHKLATQGMRVLIIDLHRPLEGFDERASAASAEAASRGARGTARYRKPLWLRGDARDRDTLARANIGRARKVFICTGIDDTNLQLVRRLFDFLKAGANQERRISVRVQLLSDDARRAVRDWLGWYSFIGQHAVDIEAFNIHEIAARELLIRFSPDRFRRTDFDDPIAQVVVVAGASRMAQELVARAARLGHFSVGGKLRIVWIDPDIESVAQQLRAATPHIDWRHPDAAPPGLEQAVQVIPLAHHLSDVLRKDVLGQITPGRTPSVFWACHDDAARNAAQVRDFCARYNRDPATADGAGRAVAVQFNHGLGLSNAADNQAMFEGFAFMPAEAIIMDYAVDVLCDGQRDNLAKYINTVIYSKKNYASDAERQWAHMPELLRESNRDAADHAYISLRLCGMPADAVDRLLAAPDLQSAQPAAPADGAGPAHLLRDALEQSLSVLEHRRYSAFMLGAGFIQGQADPARLPALAGMLDLASRKVFDVDKAAKHWERIVRVNPALVPSDTLATPERIKDDDIVAHMVKLGQPVGKARVARKRNIPVQVGFSDTAGEVRTLEGVASYGAGSAIVTGGRGEQWPIERAAFEDKYRPGDGIRMGEDGEYFPLPRSVTAIQLPAPASFALSNNRGMLSGRAGDWLVQHADGDIGVVARDVFETSYTLDA